MNLDALAAVFTGLMALCLFTVFAISSPRRHHWITLPLYVRGGLLVTGVMFTWRSVNFVTMARQLAFEPIVIGHINAEGMMALVAITYTCLAVTVFTVLKMLPGRGWDRLGWVFRKERESDAHVPVIMTAAEVESLALDRGFHVNAKPPESLH